MFVRGQTTHEMMERSRPFRYFYWGSAIFAFFGMVLLLIYFFTAHLCTASRSCASEETLKYVCLIRGVPYCCPVTVRECDSLYCYRQWTDYCLGLLISAGILMSVAVLLAVLALLMFCNFRHRARMGEYLRMAEESRRQAVEGR